MAGPGFEASLVLADGRVLEYWEGGDPAGPGVIFHPGTPVTRLLGRWGHDAALAAGVRLVAVSRPGYGGSTMIADTPSLLAVGRDTAFLAAHLGLDGYAVFGSSGGGPFALATAVADPGTVRALGLVGGVGPWRLLEPLSVNTGEREALALQEAGDLAGAWDCMRRTSSFWRDGGLVTIDDAVDAILADEKSSLIHDEGYRAIWADNVRVVLDDLDGYTFDNFAWGGTWDMDPREVVAPSLLWYGAIDKHCPPAHGQYADRIAGSQLIVFPGGGHFDVIDSHWPEVLAGLLRVWG